MLMIIMAFVSVVLVFVGYIVFETVLCVPDLNKEEFASK